MLLRWSKAVNHFSRIGSQNNFKFSKDLCALTRQTHIKVLLNQLQPILKRQVLPEDPWLEKTFQTTYSLLVLHMWLILRCLKQEGKEGVEFGQYLYEIYNHDVELRVSKAGVNLLLTRWMKDLEKIFYGNIVAYDTAMLPKLNQMIFLLNIFSDDGLSTPDAAALRSVQVIDHRVDEKSMLLRHRMSSRTLLQSSLYRPALGKG